MKSLLIGINAKYIHPALAIYQLKANTSCEVSIYETTIKEPFDNIYNYLVEQINRGILHLAFSTYLWNIEIIISLLKKLKPNFPNIIVSAGGPEVGYDVNNFLMLKQEEQYLFDYLIRGEGENAFNELCLFLDKKIPLEEVTNLSYRNNEQIINNPLHYPDLTKLTLGIFDVPNYQNRIIYLESSRGCPFHCSYCTASLENNVRYFPHELVIETIKRLMKEEVKVVKFLDRTFNANMKYMSEILETIKAYNKRTVFQFEVVADLLTPKMIALISSMPRKYLRLEIGIQTTNQNANSAINRKQNIDKLKNNIALLLATNKVDLHVDLIAGLPYEDKPSFITSFNETFKMKPTELQLGFLKFLRGTKMLDLVNKHKYIYDNKPPYEIIQNAYLSKTDLTEIHLVEDALDKFYNSQRFLKTFAYLEDKISSFYDFFLNLSFNSNSLKSLRRQLPDLYLDFDNYLKLNFDNYAYLHFLIKQDYLNYSKARPKIWWEERLQKEERMLYYQLLVDNYPELTIDILYRYGLLITHQDNEKTEIVVAIYKDYQPYVYHLRIKP